MPAERCPLFNTQTDLRGYDNTYINLLSAPGISFAAKTTFVDFLLPNPPQLVHGSFFTSVSWIVRGHSGQLYAIVANASAAAFDVIDGKNSSLVVAQRRGQWQTFEKDGLIAVYKMRTLYVRANGWEVRRSPG